MMCAARCGHKAVVQPLLDKEANVHAKDKHGETILHVAAQNKYEAVVRLLLEKEADANAKDNIGKTVLYKAAEHGTGLSTAAAGEGSGS